MIYRLVQRLRRSSLHYLKSRDAYAKWANDYPPTPHNVLMEIEQQAMLALMPSLKNKRVLDLACGTGRYGLIAKEQGASVVIGIDDSIDMLTRSPLDRRVLGNMADIPLADNSLDLVVCGLAIGHYPDLAAVLREIKRVLCHDGLAVISDFHPFQYLGGGRRTFTRDNITYEVEHYPHLYEKIHDACQTIGLTVQEVQEPTVAGQGVPVVIVYRLLKN